MSVLSQQAKQNARTRNAQARQGKQAGDRGSFETGDAATWRSAPSLDPLALAALYHFPPHPCNNACHAHTQRARRLTFPFILHTPALHFCLLITLLRRGNIALLRLVVMLRSIQLGSIVAMTVVSGVFDAGCSGEAVYNG